LFDLGIHLAPVAIRARQVYQGAFGTGQSAAEIQKNSPAASEIARLWAYLESRLSLNQQGERAMARPGRSAMPAKGASAA
jgi:hypothetical protein